MTIVASTGFDLMDVDRVYDKGHETKAPKALPGKERKATLARKLEGNSGKGGKGDKGKSSEKGGGKNPKSNRQCWKCGNFGRHGYECCWRLRKVIGRLLFIGARTHLRHTCARRWKTSYRTGRSLYSAADPAKGNPDVGRDLRRTQCACASAWLEFDVRFYSSPPIGINFQKRVRQEPVLTFMSGLAGRA